MDVSRKVLETEINNKQRTHKDLMFSKLLMEKRCGGGSKKALKQG